MSEARYHKRVGDGIKGLYVTSSRTLDTAAISDGMNVAKESSIHFDMVKRSKQEKASHKKGRRKQTVLKNDKQDWVVVGNAHVGIISKDDWLAVQAQKRRSNENPNKGRRAKDAFEYILRGLVYCECGAKVHGGISRRRKNDKVYEKRTYVCSAYNSYGTR